MEILTIGENNLREIVVRAVELLRAREVVALPTDTVYGLAVDARSEVAIEKIFALKGRDKEKALPVFVNSFEMLEDVAYIKDEKTKRLLGYVWPGAVTCVLPARGWMPLSLRGGGLSIGVRMPDSVLVAAIIKEWGGPITGTSANISGNSACITAQDVSREFKNLPLKPALIVDDGGRSVQRSSTVLDCTGWPPAILREGAVTREEIYRIIRQANER
jgi:L-threonylcarbamoyladenylate synthase